MIFKRKLYVVLVDRGTACSFYNFEVNVSKKRRDRHYAVDLTDPTIKSFLKEAAMSLENGKSRYTVEERLAQDIFYYYDSKKYAEKAAARSSRFMKILSGEVPNE